MTDADQRADAISARLDLLLERSQTMYVAMEWMGKTLDKLAETSVEDRQRLATLEKDVAVEIVRQQGQEHDLTKAASSLRDAIDEIRRSLRYRDRVLVTSISSLAVLVAGDLFHQVISHGR